MGLMTNDMLLPFPIVPVPRIGVKRGWDEPSAMSGTCDGQRRNSPDEESGTADGRGWTQMKSEKQAAEKQNTTRISKAASYELRATSQGEGAASSKPQAASSSQEKKAASYEPRRKSQYPVSSIPHQATERNPRTRTTTRTKDEGQGGDERDQSLYLSSKRPRSLWVRPLASLRITASSVMRTRRKLPRNLSPTNWR